jgi:hypothetical protein
VSQRYDVKSCASPPASTRARLPVELNWYPNSQADPTAIPAHTPVFYRPDSTLSRTLDFTPSFTCVSLLIAYTRYLNKGYDNVERRRVARYASSDLMYKRNTSMVHYQYLHRHNPCVQTPLYLRSAAQVWFPQIARKDQFISANSGLEFKADTLITSRLIYL